MAGKTKKSSATSRRQNLQTRSGSKAPTSSGLVDEQLERYRSMRDFSKTAEPSGQAEPAAKTESLPFVIQKHAATRLHYDFRLGLHGGSQELGGHQRAELCARR